MVNERIARMTVNDLHHESTTTASAFCGDLLLSDEAMELLEAPGNPRRFIEALVERKLFGDAYKVIAMGLGSRDGVEWALACVRGVTREPSEKEKACIAAAEAWIVEPGDETREEAKRAGGRGGYATAASWLAAAAGWTGGSVAPPDSPEVPPPRSMFASAIASALELAAVGVAEKDQETTRRRFYEQALPYVDRAATGAAR